MVGIHTKVPSGNVVSKPHYLLHLSKVGFQYSFSNKTFKDIVV